MDRLEEIKEREHKATEGPWETYDPETGEHKDGELSIGQGTDASDGPAICYCEPYIKYGESQNNARFISNAREDIPWLIRELEAAREKLNKYGHHLPDFRCGRVYFDGPPCTCGFEEALKSPKEPK